MKKLITTIMTLLMLIVSMSSFAATKALPASPVNVNTAEKAQLMTLPGIGDAKADAIIAIRTERPFKSAEDLLAVKGIGEKMLEKLMPHVTVGGAQSGKTIQH